MPGIIQRHHERGDTIIEVLFAVTVFAMVAVGSMAIMNQGTGTAQRAVEITQVRQQIDAQAEAIRYIHESYVAQFQRGVQPTGTASLWTELLMQNSKSSASSFGVQNGQCPVIDEIENAFVLNARKVNKAEVDPTSVLPENASFPPFAQVIYRDDSSVEKAYGLWIEAVRGNSTKGPNYVDFHIRACWDSPGSDVPVTLGTIVRLYEPR